MLNNKGIYYAKLIVRGIDDLKDKLVDKIKSLNIK